MLVAQGAAFDKGLIWKALYPYLYGPCRVTKSNHPCYESSFRRLDELRGEENISSERYLKEGIYPFNHLRKSKRLTNQDD